VYISLPRDCQPRVVNTYLAGVVEQEAREEGCAEGMPHPLGSAGRSHERMRRETPCLYRGFAYSELPGGVRSQISPSIVLVFIQNCPVQKTC